MEYYSFVPAAQQSISDVVLDASNRGRILVFRDLDSGYKRMAVLTGDNYVTFFGGTGNIWKKLHCNFPLVNGRCAEFLLVGEMDIREEIDV